MEKTTAGGVFKTPPKVEKADATTRAARDIIARQTSERDAKTERLRGLRLAKEAADKAAEPEKKPVVKKATAKKAAVAKEPKAAKEPKVAKPRTKKLVAAKADTETAS